jgi:glycosyltransferase involved in cell wall biosynthesis
MSKVDLSFAIPAYNLESSIEDVLYTLAEAVKSETLEYEIVVVHNGTKNKTLSKAMTFASKNGHVKVLSYTENVRKGYAVKTGFMLVTSEVVILADSDMDIDLAHVTFKPFR